jgi:ankyrin repeat protein
LEDLPKTLDETYGRTLLGIDDEKREYAQRLFRCLAVSIRPLRVEELAEVLAIRFPKAAPPTFNAAWRPENAEEAVLSACSSLISIVDTGDNQVVQFSHFSVKEYLTSERLTTAEERLSYYHILPEAAHTVLAHAGLSVLLQLDDKIDRNTIAHFPLAPYAARYWVDHAQFRNVSSQIQEVMERLFNPARPHFAAWVWVHDIDHPWTQSISTMDPTQPEAMPLYYASLCGFRALTEHLIAAHSPDVNSRGGSQMTALHAASVKGHFDVASLLLKNGADPDSRDDRGNAPLHRLAQGGLMAKSSLEIARLLVNSANVDVTDDEGWTPLHAAARSGYREIAELLLGSGASLDARNKKQQTPLELSCAHRKLDMAQFLIDRGSDINARDESGVIPLLAASTFGHVDVVRLLLDRGSDVNARTTAGQTPLHFASPYRYLDLARLLIDRGADVNAQEKGGCTPLHLASQHGCLDVARLLIDRGADVNAQQNDRWTALHHASHVGHLDLAKLLIDHDTNVDCQNDNQHTPLGIASMFGHLEVARFLVEKGAAVSAPDKEGNTPFHIAAFNGHHPVLKFFLECGIDVDIRNGYGQTSLYAASSTGKLDVIRFLIDQGANIHVVDIFDWNPLHIASLNGYLDVVQLMINTGTSVDVRDGYQTTPFALASSGGKVEVGRFLIHQGADLNVQDNQGRAPLHLAAQHGHLDMARLLLDLGVDPNIKRNDLSSPLHLASANGHLKIAELLVQRGASVDVSNDKQETPLYQAVTNGNAAIARLLIDHEATHTADCNRWTRLHAASRHAYFGVVKPLLWSADTDVLNQAERSAAELAWENGQAEVAKFISEYKANPNTRNELQSTTLNTVEGGAGDDGKDEGEVSLHAAAEEGNIDTLKSLLERGVDVDAHSACTTATVITIRTPRSLAGSSRSGRERERKEAGLLDSGAHLGGPWTPRDRETVT